MKADTDFFEKVWSVVQTIPKGKVCTYGIIGEHLGLRSSARMVGWAMNAVNNQQRQTHIPAHRVVNRNGELTGKMHFQTPTLMRALLEAEGIEFKGERVNMKKHLWIPE